MRTVRQVREHKVSRARERTARQVHEHRPAGEHSGAASMTPCQITMATDQAMMWNTFARQFYVTIEAAS